MEEFWKLWKVTLTGAGRPLSCSELHENSITFVQISKRLGATISNVKGVFQTPALNGGPKQCLTSTVAQNKPDLKTTPTWLALSPSPKLSESPLIYRLEGLQTSC